MPSALLYRALLQPVMYLSCGSQFPAALFHGFPAKFAAHVESGHRTGFDQFVRSELRCGQSRSQHGAVVCISSEKLALSTLHLRCTSNYHHAVSTLRLLHQAKWLASLESKFSYEVRVQSVQYRLGEADTLFSAALSSRFPLSTEAIWRRAAVQLHAYFEFFIPHSPSFNLSSVDTPFFVS